MRCPTCGKRPVRFSALLFTLDPFRMQCDNCGAQLRAGWFAYLYTLLHLPLGLGLIELHRIMERSDMLSTPLAQGTFIVAALGLLFCTSFVIPWYGFNRVYHLSSK